MARSFKRITANARELQNTTIGNFSGVDLSSPTLQANTARSVELLNFVKKQKFNQKRFGFHQVISKNNDNDGYSKIHGVWTFIDSTNTERVIVHIDDHFVLLNNLGSDKSYFDINQDDFATWIIDVWSVGALPIYMEVGPEENSFGFASDGYLYVLGGGKYIRFKYDAASEDIVAEDLTDNFYSTFIPLTRNSIVPTGSSVEGLSQAYDDVNMLTQWKKNAMITGTFGNNLTSNPFHSSGYTEFQLDSNVNPKTFSDLNDSVLKLSYLKVDATALTNANYTSALTWTSNIITIGPSTPSEVEFNDFIFSKVAYRSGNPGRDYNIKDIAVRLKYKLDTFGSISYETTPYIKSAGTGGLILTNTADTTVYTPTDTTSYKYTIDYRPAISGGYLTATANPEVYHISAAAEALGYIEVPIKLFLKFINIFNSVYTFTLTTNLRIPIQSDAEFLAYQTKIDITATPQNITTHELVFKDGSTSIAKLYFGNDDEPAKLHLYYISGIDYENPTVGTPNMYITFPNWVPGYSERVTNCKFGKLWGYNGARNRLFISGNLTHKNVVYHTTQVNFYTKLTSNEIENLSNDFTYFSDLDYNIIGTDNFAINGLEVLANGNLLVLKEESALEPSLYTIKASLTDALSFDGTTVKASDGTALREEIYLANVGNQGHGGINPLAVANLNSDTVFLSNVGLRAFILSENLPVEETRSVPSSTLIDNKLVQDKTFFSSAVMYFFDGYLYLALNGTIYVAKEDEQAKDMGPKEYEWWVLKGYEYVANEVKNYADIKVRNFLNYDGELYFYNENGLFKFVENQYVDKQSIYFPDGYITYAHPNQYDFNGDETLLYTNPLVLQNLSLEKYIAFKTEQYHAISSVLYDGTTNRITFASHPTLKAEEIYEGRKVTFTSAGSDFLGNYYYLYNVNTTTSPYSAQLKKMDGTLVTDWTNFYIVPAPGPIAILSGIIEPGKELKVNFINESSSEFTVMGDFEVVVRFAYVHLQTPDRKFYIVTNDNVVAYFVTAPFNFGSNSQYKTIERFVLTNDTRIDSYVEILYIASNQANTFREITNSNNDFNFSNITMTNLYFGSTYLPLPFTLRANMRNVSSIMFKFYNDRDDNACLTNLTMLYYLTKKVR